MKAKSKIIDTQDSGQEEKRIQNLSFRIHPSKFSLQNSSFGFTLIEVIIAIAILSIGFTMIMQLFSGGLKASRATCDYTRAIVHAKDKMEELSDTMVHDSGEFEDGFRWESEVQPYKELEDAAFNLLKIIVKVSWLDVRDKERSVELISLKAVSDENEK